ncbi:MAG: hypothetical protein ACYTXA_19550 [Nostoc sp.]
MPNAQYFSTRGCANDFSTRGYANATPAFLTSPAIALLVILTQNMFRAFLNRYFLTQYEKPESRLDKALRIVVRNPGTSLREAAPTTPLSTSQYKCPMPNAPL